jgi:nitrogen fixation/metabolism regulation signal transduction histidine kinase
MKTSIRSKSFTMGMVLFIVIILLLSISSAYYLNKLSRKTSTILKENHYSVVYAREMSEKLININQGIVNSFLTNKIPDTSTIYREFILFNKSLEQEKKNITEIGEDQLVSKIEKNYSDYHNSVLEFIKSPDSDSKVLYLRTKVDTLYKQLMLLSQMNEKAIEERTNDAKVSAKKATLQMTFIGTICFLIAYGFTFYFSSYFNERFYELYDGIKELVASHYNHKIHLDGNDELYEISLTINEMATELDKNKQKMSVPLQKDPVENNNLKNIQDLKNFLAMMKSLEEQAKELLSRIEKK